LKLQDVSITEQQRLQVFAALGEAVVRKLGIYELPAGFKLSVAMPVYNEKATIREIISRVRRVPLPIEIVIVDDGSTDGTRDILAEYEGDEDLQIIYHEKNAGKGAALKTAFSHAQGDVVVVQDADLEYDPSEFPKLIQPIVEGRADVVYGSRFKGNSTRTHLFWHRLANGLLTLLSNCMTNLNLTDMETCYKVFRRELLDDINIKQRGFGVEPELTAKIARRHVRIYEMPISYDGRDYAEGKKIGFKDALVALYCIVRYAIAE
jgi:glycosyltransferase involved in cell wall biosynthesis